MLQDIQGGIYIIIVFVISITVTLIIIRSDIKDINNKIKPTGLCVITVQEGQTIDPDKVSRKDCSAIIEGK